MISRDKQYRRNNIEIILPQIIILTNMINNNNNDNKNDNNNDNNNINNNNNSNNNSTASNKLIYNKR